MKLKYYLRGLGIGILVTTIILIIAHINSRSISDEEIIRRAKKLGMVEQKETLFADNDSTTAESDAPVEETTEPKTDSTEEETTEPKTDSTEEETTEPETDSTEEETTEPETAGTDYITATIVISRGMYSEAVSQIMQKAGLIDNWVEFNEFLSNNGYEDRLQTGSYTLNSGMSFEEMAVIITQ